MAYVGQPKPCWCGGYWFPHRKGGGACDHSKTRDIHLAIRYKDKDALADAIAGYAWDHPGKGVRSAPCPF